MRSIPGKLGKRAAVLCPYITFISLTCRAGHMTHEEYERASRNLNYLLAFVLLTIVINIWAIIVGLKATTRAWWVFSVAAICDVIWIVFCLQGIKDRYDEHQLYLRTGPADADVAGWHNASTKAVMILILFLLGAVGNVLFLRKALRNR